MYDIQKPGAAFAGAMLCRALHLHEPHEAIAKAVHRYGRTSAEVAVLRAAIPGAEAADLGTSELAGAAHAQLIQAIEEASLLGRLRSARRVAPQQPFVWPGLSSAATWVGEGKAAPVSRLALSKAALPGRKTVALVVATQEALQSPGAAEAIRHDLVNATARALDGAFLDRNWADDGETPAGVGYGVLPIASTNDPAADIAAAIEAFTGDLRTAAWIMQPATAVALALRLGGVGLAADLGALGGTLCGIPVLTSAAEAVSTNGFDITLIDAAGLAYVLENLTVSTTDQGMLELDDEPTGDVLAPTAATATRVALWQAEAVAFKAVQTANWRAVRAPVIVAGVDYGSSS